MIESWSLTIPSVRKLRMWVSAGCVGADLKAFCGGGLEGVMISFKPQCKELVLNEHRPLTDSPHPEL